jgi:hypothetical protein
LVILTDGREIKKASSWLKKQGVSVCMDFAMHMYGDEERCV